MEIANESHWRTEDLCNLVQGVKDMPDYREGYRVYQNTLLLFRTGVPRPTKEDKKDFNPPAAFFDSKDDRWYNTLVIKIRSRMALEMDVLDRMAHIGENFEQDMPSGDVIKLAKEVAKAIGYYDLEYENFDWAAKINMRSTSEVKRSSVALERKIIALENRQSDIVRKANAKVRKIDSQIEELRKVLGDL